MLVRFRLDWPDYPTWLYLVSFGVTTIIFVASFYLGGLYEREPRLGAPPVLPRALPQALVAGGFVALITLVATGIGRELGLTTARALPFPILNLSIVIVLGAVAATANRRMAHLVRTGREGFPRVVLVGTDEERARARDGLELEGARALVVGEVGTVDEVLAAVEEGRATDVLLLSRDWLDAVFPDVIEHLEHAGVTVLLRVTARETLLGLDRVREVAGMPFVLVRAHAIPVSRARLKRLFDLACCCSPRRCGCRCSRSWRSTRGSRPGGRCCTCRSASAVTGGPSAWSSSAPCVPTRRTTGSGHGSPPATTRGSSRRAAGCGRAAWTSSRSSTTCCGRDVARRSAPGAPGAGRRARAPHPRLRTPPRAAAGHDRAGADLRPLPHRRRVQARLRPAVPGELVAGARPRDPVQDRVGRCWPVHGQGDVGLVHR
jgi:hypothetical protein